MSLGLAFLILLATGISSWHHWTAFRAASDEAERTQRVFEQTEALVSSLKDAETGQRGFLLTSNASYLEPYDRAIAAIPGQLAKLRANTAGSQAQREAVARLVPLIDAKLAELKETIVLRKQGGVEAALALVRTDRGKELVDRIRDETNRITALQSAILIERSRDAERQANLAWLVNSAGGFLLFLLLAFSVLVIYRATARREQLIAALQDDDKRLRDLRDKAEEAEEQVRNILESITDGFMSFDRDWNVMFCNTEAEKMLGRPKAQVIGKNFWTQFGDSATEAVKEKYHLAAVERAPVSFEIFLQSRNVWWEENVYPARDGGLSVYLRDVTERKHTEERARHSHKLESLGVLAGGIAHDFNNLLTAILGSASLMLDELPRTSPAVPLAENVINASERASQLTRQMLAYSGRGRFVVEPLDLAQQVREITALLEASVTSKVQLSLHLQSEGVLIEADSGQIQQLVMNLVINGAEAIGEQPGQVIVSTRVQELDEQFVRDNMAGDNIRTGAFVLLEVHDTGQGMDEATMARIFDPFFTTKFTGRGLGLAAVLGIVRGHSGAIKVYSHPGQGTTFKVFLPVASGQTLNKTPPPDGDYRGTGTILVVDDEEVVQSMARSTLERYGYRVMIAANGLEAVDLFRSMGDCITLVLLDMTMPLLSGEDTLRRLREMRPDVRVIASSGYNEIEAMRRFGTGINGFLQKPYRAVQLAEKIKTCLASNAGAAPV